MEASTLPECSNLMDVVRQAAAAAVHTDILDDLLQRVIEAVVEAMNAESASVYLMDPGGTTLTMRAGCGRHRHLVGTAQYDLGEGITGLLASGEPLNFQTYSAMRNHPCWKGKFDTSIWPGSPSRPRNLLGLPIALGSHVLGIWKVENLTPSPHHPEEFFTSQDVETARVLSAFLAYAVEREQFRSEVFRNLKLLAKSSIGIENAKSEEDAILAVMLALEDSGFGDAILSLYDPHSREVRGHLASRGVKSEVLSKIRSQIDGDGLLGTALLNNEAIFISDSGSDPRCDTNVMRALNWKAQYVVPLRLEDELLGTLQVSMGDADQLGEDEALILQAFGGHLAIATSRARSIRRSVELTDQVMSGSRFIVAETLSGMAVHSLGHKLDDILNRLNEDLKKREVRERKDVLALLTNWKNLLTEGRASLRNALELVRGSGSERSERIDIHTAAQEAIDMWITFIHQNRCAIQPQFSAKDSTLTMSSHAFREIMSVLIVNSVQAHAKRIIVKTSNLDALELSPNLSFDRTLVLDFEDDGDGLATNKPDEIFEATYTTKSEKFGTGLGLFIARRLARESGGDLFVLTPTRQKSKGATLRLVLSLD